MRAAIYARYSSNLQTDASIEDQCRLCRRVISSHGWSEADVYADAALSGASNLRPSYQRMLEDGRNGRFDVVVSEGLDRISRDQEHIAAFYKQMRFQGIPIVTVAEGEISELHIGLKGTMSSLFLKDLAQKTHRGLEGRVRQGKSAGGVTYGYRVLRSVNADGNLVTGERAIHEHEAEVVRRIFEEYAAGRSPRSIAAGLNQDGIAGPRVTWGASTIYGNWRRGTGILNNELYVGQLVWNRQRFIKDPDTGKRQARPNPPEDWVIEAVPNLRIVAQDLWDRVKARQTATRSAMISEGLSRPERARRPAHMFSGLTKCGCCGGGFTMVGKEVLGCAASRNKGTCDNKLTIRRERLESAVLDGLKAQLLQPELISEFVRAYQEEHNRLSRERQKGRQNAERELAKTLRQIDKIVDAVAEGLYHPSMKGKLDELEARKVSLKADLIDAEEEPLRLHPGLAEVYRQKVATLTEALGDPGLKAEAAQHIRGLVQKIRLVPDNGELAIELVGELASIMALGEPETTKARGGATGCSVKVVAGVGFEPTTFRL